MTNQSQFSKPDNIISKYNLDISFVEIKDLELQTRMDAEFYQRKYMCEKANIERHNYVTLDTVSEKITDWTHYTPTYTESGVPFLSALNVLENQINLSSYCFISEEEHKQLYKRANPEIWNILMRKVGVWPRHASVLWDVGFEFSIFVSVALIKLKKEYQNANFYISTFINSFYWQNQLLRFNKGASQPDLHLEDIKELKIPLPSLQFQSIITSLVQTAHNEIIKSKSLYLEAEKVLLEELNLLDWKPVEINIDIKTIEDIKFFGRCDAEFFQPKYDEIINKIKWYNDWYTIISDKFKLNTERTPFLLESYNYVEIGDINTSNGEITPNVILTEDLPTNAKILLKKWDLLVSTVRPNRGAVGIIESDMKDLIWSWAFTVLQQKNDSYLKEVLLIILRTPIYKELMLRYNIWTSYPVIKDIDVLNLPIPLIDSVLQSKISSLIISSHEALKLSKSLLEQAKNAVEVFVEKNEESAMKIFEKSKL